MLILETVLGIRREHASGKAIKAIARDLHLSRKVVRKAIRAPEADMVSAGGTAAAEAKAVSGATGRVAG
jgi:hypothetical protein